MGEVFRQTSCFAIVLTLAAYQLGLWVQKKGKHPLCNPLLISIFVVLGVLLALDIPVEEYTRECERFSWLLTPATVCMAVPLYQQVKVLKKSLPAIVLGVVAGVAASLCCITLMCRMLGLSNVMHMSLLPKSITAAMGLAVCQQLGGIQAVTTAAITITGISACVLGNSLCKLFRLRNPIAKGVAFGTASHVLGSNHITQESELSGAVGSLSLVVAGILTALVCPGWFSIFG